MSTPPTEKDGIDDAATAAPAETSEGVSASAMAELFRLSLRQHVRGRRLWVVGFLFALPAAIAAVALWKGSDVRRAELENGLIFTLFPHALLPLAALWYASGMIQDELEEQTLTYLLMRPLPRWSIYVAKLLATVFVTSLLAAGGVAAAYAAIYATDAEAFEKEIPLRALKVIAIFALVLWAYCSVFGCLSLFFRRSLLLGVSYTVVLEWIASDIPFVVRRATVMYYFRVLVERWVAVGVADWDINLGEAPATRTCVLVLALAGATLTTLAAAGFAAREFRVKSPEGS